MCDKFIIYCEKGKIIGSMNYIKLGAKGTL